MTLRFPVEVGTALTVYRVNDSGTKTLLTGELSKDKKYYEVKTTAMGLFATSVTEAQLFSDVPVNHWAAESIRLMVEKGLFNGTSDDAFSPNGTMTRAMLFTVLHRLSGEAENAEAGESWYSAAMEWAVAEEISDGSNPNGNITREQMAAMLYRYSGSPAVTGDLSSYTDAASVSAWASDAMKWAVSEGIITGLDGNRLDPNGYATRAQVAVMIDRMLAADEADA